MANTARVDESHEPEDRCNAIVLLLSGRLAGRNRGDGCSEGGMNVDSELRGSTSSAAGDQAVLAHPLADSRRCSTFVLSFHASSRPSIHVACY